MKGARGAAQQLRDDRDVQRLIEFGRALDSIRRSGLRVCRPRRLLAQVLGIELDGLTVALSEGRT